MSLFGKIFGGVVGFVVGGPPGAVAGAAIGDSKPAQKVFNAAGQVVGDAADTFVEVVGGFGEIIWKGGVAVVDAVGDVAKSAYNLVHGTVAFRSLRPSEIAVLETVFMGSVPYRKIVVCSIIGISNRPLCLPGEMLTAMQALVPGIGPALAIHSLLRNLDAKYVLCLGIEGYNRGLSMPFDGVRGGQTLVHEVMHVWQGDTGGWSGWYVAESVRDQCTCGLQGIDAYNATEGAQFHTYTVEQQARLIERWYTGAGTERRRSGANVPNAASMRILEAYVTEIIRKRRPKADITIPSAMGIGTTTSALSASALMAGGPAAGALARPLTPQQMQQYTAQAEAMTRQAQALRATGNPMLIAQAQALEAQAAQLRVLGGRRISAASVTGTSPLLRR